MSASPTILKNSGDTVTLEFSGVPDPKDSDWIGVFSPSTVDIKKTAPIKYQVFHTLQITN
jgi:hypothetical protein